jgi:hypothetical protein
MYNRFDAKPDEMEMMKAFDLKLTQQWTLTRFVILPVWSSNSVNFKGCIPKIRRRDNMGKNCFVIPMLQDS